MLKNHRRPKIWSEWGKRFRDSVSKLLWDMSDLWVLRSSESIISDQFGHVESGGTQGLNRKLNLINLKPSNSKEMRLLRLCYQKIPTLPFMKCVCKGSEWRRSILMTGLRLLQQENVSSHSSRPKTARLQSVCQPASLQSESVSC